MRNVVIINRINTMEFYIQDPTSCREGAQGSAEFRGRGIPEHVVWLLSGE